MFFSLSSIRKPKQEFNLLHLETQEYYFLSLKVSLHNNNEIRGKLHICSRSLVFQPNQPKLPMIKMKYSNNLILKILRNIDTKTMNQIMSIKWTPSLLMEDIDSLDINQLYQHFKRDKNNELLDRLYKVQSRTANSQYTIMFLRVDKLFVINRNPISPYITETCDENIVFSISQSNSKQNIVRFLKLYQGLTQAEDENSFISTIINTTLNEAMNEHRAYSSQQGLKIELAVKCKLIRPEGNIYGLFSIQRDEGIKYIPLINSPKGKILMWQLTDIKFFLKYRYMFKQIGLEIWFFNKKRSVLLAFEDPQQLDTVYKYLIRKTTKNQISSITVEKLTELWVDGSLSNFDYLMSLNTFSSRSFCDLSAYPVFPWVIAEYTDKTFDLTSPEFFRDLSRPVGALNKHRLQKYKQSYQEQLKSLKNNNNNDIIPYIYPTHYSSPGTVVYYLIRKIPEFVIKLQNGVFGPTDRIFRGIDSTWYTTLNLHADSKELIPEFYSLDPDFLINCDKLELGMTQEGEIIDDAIIPPWANSMTDFLLKMRMALESDYVSSQLPKWIDLIFGCKTRGDEAVKQDNLFYPYTYAENVNWNQCRTSIEKQALETQVAEFGQVPIQLFNSSHPNRKLKIHPSLKQKQQQQLNSSSQRNLQLTDIQQESQNKDYVTCLQNQVSSLQWENEKLKFNLDTIKQELQLQKIETFNSQYDQEEIDKKGQDLMSDDSLYQQIKM
ncbi:unnamed protein product [Paramecium octaurelia]|uniref:Uncharacterized protein n=1 Tax=Paramecium octaurelia TaxID=43137 RepID=A0A8S1UPU3_PAROT|nr:unnamed protein product [Paramecium octaurelia]